jgi:LysR family hydrogen peroxide-inducible transcriptional activator
MKPVAFRLKAKFETLIKLADEGLGTTLLPYLHTLDLKKDKLKLRHFEPNLQRSKSYFSKRN